jgi:hypothetical protein
MRKRKFFYLIIVILFLTGFIGYNYIYKSHRNISEEKAKYTVNAVSFIKEFNNDIEASITKYLDKTIQLKGKITEIEQSNFMLNNAIVCYTDSITLTQIKKDLVVTVKGRNIGYDELLEFLKFDQITIINN